MLLIMTPENDVWIQPTLVVAGKAVSSIFWLGCGLHSPEVFPTSTRNAAFCFLDATSKIGAAVAPFIVDLLAIVDKTLPNIAIGFITLTAAIPFFFLPETRDTDIPETIEDMAQMNDIIANKCCRKVSV
jgi:hypothetical protein